MLVERAFGRIVGRLLLTHQEDHKLSDHAVARVARVTQPHWTRIRHGLASPGASGAPAVGERLISGLAVSMPDLLRAAIDEVQMLKAAEIERLRSSDSRVGASV